MERKLVALITGASSGIGKATAFKLIDNGYKVYTLYPLLQGVLSL